MTIIYKLKTGCQWCQLACSDPIAGNHNDAFELVKTFDKMINTIQLATMPIQVLFLKCGFRF